MSDYTPSDKEILTAVVVYRAISKGEAPPSIRELALAEEVEQYLGEYQRWKAAFKRDTEIALLERLAESGQAKMFAPAVYVGPRRMKLAVTLKEWLMEQADALRKDAS